MTSGLERRPLIIRRRATIRVPGMMADPEEIRFLIGQLGRAALIVLDELDRVEEDDGLSMLADTVKTLRSQHRGNPMFVGVGGSVEHLLAEHESMVRNVRQVPMRSPSQCAGTGSSGWKGRSSGRPGTRSRRSRSRARSGGDSRSERAVMLPRPGRPSQSGWVMSPAAASPGLQREAIPAAGLCRPRCGPGQLCPRGRRHSRCPSGAPVCGVFLPPWPRGLPSLKAYRQPPRLRENCGGLPGSACTARRLWTARGRPLNRVVNTAQRSGTVR